MSRCQSCGYPIEGEAREMVSEPGSGARPTVYWHLTAAECTQAKEERTVSSPLQRRLRRS